LSGKVSGNNFPRSGRARTLFIQDSQERSYTGLLSITVECEVVAFFTDSICANCDLGLKSSKLRDFSLKSGDDAYYLQNGIYRFNGKWKLRGIGKAGGKTVEHVATIEKGGRLCLVLMPTRSASLKECVVQNRIQDIGKIRPVKKLVNLNDDGKRFWFDTLKSVDDGLCNDSLSLSLNHFSKEEI
jgi:hypothetical protein